LAVRSKSAKATFTEQARRGQIIAAAIDVLADRGYPATSMAAIAAHIGISKGVISYYFAGKEELLREVVSSVLTEAVQYMQPSVRGATTHAEALHNYLVANLDYIDSHRREIRALTEIFNATPPGATHPYAEGHQNAVRALSTLLRNGQRAGEFGEFSTDHVAVAIRGAIDAVSEILRADPDADVHSYGTEIAGLFERGVRAW
jgi:AcrR family transcriptional regulator